MTDVALLSMGQLVAIRRTVIQEASRRRREADRIGGPFDIAAQRYAVLPSRIRKMVDQVADQHDVSPLEICGDSRVREIAHARFAVWAILHAEGKSKPRIGHLFGRDHTSVLSGLRRHAEIQARAA